MDERIVWVIAIVVCLAVGPYFVWQMFEALDAEMALAAQAQMAKR